MNNKLEHQMITIKPKDRGVTLRPEDWDRLIAEANNFGEDGWELFQVIPIQCQGVGILSLRGLLKRPALHPC